LEGRVLAFEIFVNGVRVRTVGFPQDGVTSVHIDYISGDVLPEAYSLRISGLDAIAREYLHWTCPPVSQGDEITVRLVDANEVDEPDHRQRGSGGEPCRPGL
jgi:hypothetical protein